MEPDVISIQDVIEVLDRILDGEDSADVTEEVRRVLAGLEWARPTLPA